MRCWMKIPNERPGIETLRRDIERAFSEIFGLNIDAESSELNHLAMNLHVPPERQLNVNLVHTFVNTEPEFF